MWWFGLFFDRLSLDVARCGAGGPGDDARPLAISDRLRILDADDGARALGVAPGMKRAAALALAPALRLCERDDANEQATIDSLAAWALQFTPAVSLQSDLPFGELDDTPRPCGLLLEVAPSLRYFGGSAALLAQLRQGLRTLGFPARIGAAPTAAAAWLFARHRDGLHAERRLDRLDMRAAAEREVRRRVNVRLGRCRGLVRGPVGCGESVAQGPDQRLRVLARALRRVPQSAGPVIVPRHTTGASPSGDAPVSLGCA